MSIKSKNILLIIFAIFFALDVFLVFSFENQDTIDDLKIIFFDVGQGDATMVDVGNGMQILIDGGDGKNILDKLGKYMPFYDRKIELVIMTHPDKDHMGGLVEVLKYYEVERVLETGIECEKAICKEWDKLIKEKNIPVTYAYFGQRINAGDINMVVLYPFENLKDQEVKNSNDASIVLKLISEQEIQFESVEILLTGDAGFPVEQKLLDRNVNIEARILKVSHHGSKHATSNEFLQAVKPEKAVVSVGKNSYGHPTEELLNRLKNLNVEFFRTDVSGDLVFDLN